MADDRNSDLDGARVGPPPDLPSLLLHNRIVYLGMPLVPAVTELIIAEVRRRLRRKCVGRSTLLGVEREKMTILSDGYSNGHGGSRGQYGIRIQVR